MASAARWQAVCEADRSARLSGVDHELGLVTWRGGRPAQHVGHQPRPAGLATSDGDVAADPQGSVGAERRHPVSTTGTPDKCPVSPGWSGQVWSTGWKGVSSTTTTSPVGPAVPP